MFNCTASFHTNVVKGALHETLKINKQNKWKQKRMENGEETQRRAQAL